MIFNSLRIPLELFFPILLEVISNILKTDIYVFLDPLYYCIIIIAWCVLLKLASGLQEIRCEPWEFCVACYSGYCKA